MKILFWNTNRNKNINKYISSLIYDNDIDILIMAEYMSDISELEVTLSNYNRKLYVCNTMGCKRIDIMSDYVNVEPATQDSYYSIQIIEGQYIICGVHLFTDLHGDQSDERLVIAQQIMHDIAKVEKEINSKKTLIIGDFNEMPYDKGCLSANGFHGLPVLNEFEQPNRIVKGNSYRKFYNPMWNFMGDYTYPPGTYYLNQSKLNSPMWYMLDQIIVSKDILPIFIKESVKIITECSYADLKNDKGIPDKKISDHFPIMCEIKDNK